MKFMNMKRFGAAVMGGVMGAVHGLPRVCYGERRNHRHL